LASALVIRQKLPLKKCWLYCPRGPLADYQNPEALLLLLKKIRDIAAAENAVFFRFDPPLDAAEKIDWDLLGAHPAHAHYQPENTLILDLSQSEQAILNQMKPKGRYNIKIAQKHGVKVRVSDGNEADVDAYFHLLQQTTARDEFSGHPKKYYSDMLAILKPGHSHILPPGTESGASMPVQIPRQEEPYAPHAQLYLAEYQGQVVAGIIVTFYKDTAIYYFGASSNEHRNVMAPYLLQWQAILGAKARGCKYYDFLGIAPEGAADHPWSGVTGFKLKFGGKRLDYQPAREIVYNPFWYLLVKVLKKVRR
jgi:lipid II:glycine glycyltransferase (peptidoglycan interpeptide bridge formation enzyme)